MILDTEDLSGEDEIQVTAHTLEVVGIYQIENRQGSSSFGGDPAECDMEENFIFTDTAYIRQVYEELIGQEIPMRLPFLWKIPRSWTRLWQGLPNCRDMTGKNM